jgi:glycerophosphoryl diester phosphodiesterase
LIRIFAHRAIVNTEENSLEGICKCVEYGFDMELDLRVTLAGVYLSHDNTGSGPSFEEACKVLQGCKNQIALHIKEIEALKPAIKIVKRFSLDKNCFMFMTDMPFEQVLQHTGNQASAGYYASKRPSTIEPRIFWCDEINERWYDKDILSAIRVQNKHLIAMSPELIKECDLDFIKNEWTRLISLGFDGICTNWPTYLLEFIGRRT